MGEWVGEPPPLLVRPSDSTKRVWIITLNRPRVRNAVDAALAEAMSSAMDDFESDPLARVAVLTGAGGCFSSGMDLKGFARGRGAVAARGFAGLVERPPAKPIIAAVEGYAYAGGFEIALACDLIVAGRSASFALTEVRRGLVAGGGGLLRLVAKLPLNRAAELALTGTPWTAEQACRAGLVSQVVDDGQALATACATADVIAANAPLAVTGTKQILVQSVGMGIGDAFAAQREIVVRVATSADAREGAVAFTEKRSPIWQNR